MRITTTTTTIAAACALCVTFGASYGAEVARYELDETGGTTAADSIGGHDGTIAGGVQLNQVGKLGTAFRFDGADDAKVVVSGGVGITGSAPRSISGWACANAKSQRDWCTVFGFSNGGARSGTYFDVEVDSSDRYVIHVYNYQPIFMDVDTNWHFFVATYNGANTIAMYLDGVHIATQTCPQVLDVPDEIRIGWRQNGRGFNGRVDDVRIFDHVLTPAEVTALFEEVPPSVQKATADDDDNVDDTYGAGDTVTFSFDTNMNGSTTVTGNLSGSDLNTYFSLNNGHTWGTAAVAATGAWLDVRTLRLTILDAAGGNPALGDTITIKPAAGIGNSSGSHTDVEFTCPTLSGDWGMPPNNALILYYKLDETSGTTVTDYRSGINATLNNVDLTYDATTGQIDGAIHFAYCTTLPRYARADTPASLQGMTEFTVMVWIKLDSNAYDNSVVGTPIVSLAEYNPDMLFKINNGFALVYDWVNAESTDCHFGVLTEGISVKTGATLIQTETWYHVAASYKSGQYRVYLNGALDGSGSTTFVPPSGTDLELCLSAEEGYSLFCVLDEVRIYATQLSDDFIASVYQDMEVSIETTDGTADEDASASDTGIVTINRTGRNVATAPPLTVVLSLTGAAEDPNQSPSDYDVTLVGGSALTYTGSGDRWTVTMDAGVASMTLEITAEDDLATEGPEDAVFTLVESGSYRLGAQVEAVVTIADDDTPLPFTLQSPTFGDSPVDPTVNVDFVWERPAGTACDSYTLTVSTNPDNVTTLAEVNVLDPGSGTTVTQTLTAADGLAIDQYLYWFVTAHNAVGDTEATSQPAEFYTTDTLAPSVLQITPATPGVNGPITVVFTEPIDFPAPLGATDLVFADSLGATVPGTWSANSRDAFATFTPLASLATGATYTITVSGTLTDMDGHALDGGEWTGTVTTIAPSSGGGCASGTSGGPLTVVICAIAASLLRRRPAPRPVAR